MNNIIHIIGSYIASGGINNLRKMVGNIKLPELREYDVRKYEKRNLEEMKILERTIVSLLNNTDNRQLPIIISKALYSVYGHNAVDIISRWNNGKTR